MPTYNEISIYATNQNMMKYSARDMDFTIDEIRFQN